MTPQEFCYWLQGLLEIGDPKSLDERQIAIIKDHLRLVFTKVTPERQQEPTKWPPVTPPQPISFPDPFLFPDPSPLDPYKIICSSGSIGGSNMNVVTYCASSTWELSSPTASSVWPLDKN